MPTAPLPDADALFEHAACGLVVTAADGSIRRANAQFRRWLGFSHEELQGLRLLALLTTSGRLVHQARWDRDETISELRLDMIHRDGHAVPMLLNSVRRRHAGTVLHEIAAMRITEHHRVEGELRQARRNAEAAAASRERALEESQQVLGLAIRGARMGAWSRDLATNEVWWSRELEEIMGLAPGAFAGNEAAFVELVHEADRGALDAAVTRALALRTDYVVEFRFRHASGQWRWMEGRGRALYDDRGAPMTIHGLAIDVTDRKEAELILLRQAAIFEYQTDAILITDQADVIVDANPASGRMLGVTPQALLGRPAASFFAPHAAARPGSDAAGSWDGAERGELGFVRGDGTRGVCESVVMPLGDMTGTVHGAIRIARDLSERRRDEDELRRLNAELSLADRRKDEFIATLAHELRNPLAPMRNVLEILRLKDITDPQIQWARAVLQRQMKHMTHLVDDLLEVARITQGKVELRRERVDLATAVQAAVEGVRPFVQAALVLVVALPTQPLVLDADPTRLAQVILNLLNNAVKYTPDGGRIWLAAERDGEEAVVTVRDSGIGIPPEHLDTVFEMFSQLAPAIDRAQGGLGIGLALVRGLVELHGGRVRAESAGPGQGSAFSIRLPAPRALAAARAAQEDGTGRGGAPRRILVVDDNVDAAQSLAMALGLEGHEVHTEHDGPAALAAAERIVPQVILLDIGLPQLNGYEVARQIRARPWGAGVHLVAVTGWGQAQDKRAAFDAGFDHHVTKPVALPELERLIALRLAPER